MPSRSPAGGGQREAGIGKKAGLYSNLVNVLMLCVLNDKIKSPCVVAEVPSCLTADGVQGEAGKSRSVINRRIKRTCRRNRGSSAASIYRMGYLMGGLLACMRVFSGAFAGRNLYFGDGSRGAEDMAQDRCSHKSSREFNVADSVPPLPQRSNLECSTARRCRWYEGGSGKKNGGGRGANRSGEKNEGRIKGHLLWRTEGNVTQKKRRRSGGVTMCL